MRQLWTMQKPRHYSDATHPAKSCYSTIVKPPANMSDNGIDFISQLSCKWREGCYPSLSLLKHRNLPLQPPSYQHHLSPEDKGSKPSLT